MGDMELRHRRYFIAVVEEGSLTVAAEPYTELLLGPSSAAWSRVPGEYGRVAYFTTDGAAAGQDRTVCQGLAGGVLKVLRACADHRAARLMTPDKSCLLDHASLNRVAP